MARETLPSRRDSVTTTFEHDGLKYILTRSRFADDRIAEIFLNTEMKMGSMADVSVQDGAVLVSIALQHGCPIEVMAASIKRDSAGRPQSPLGAAIDIIARETET